MGMADPSYLRINIYITNVWILTDAELDPPMVALIFDINTIRYYYLDCARFTFQSSGISDYTRILNYVYYLYYI